MSLDPKYAEYASANLILPHVWVGDMYYTKSFLKENQIEHVINASYFECSHDMRQHIPKYYEIDVMDMKNANITIHFETVFDIINKAVSEGENVLLHCQAGISRSITLMIAYILKKQAVDNDESKKWLTVEDILTDIQSKRRCADPNEGFRKQLQRLAEQLIYTREVLKLHPCLKYLQIFMVMFLLILIYIFLFVLDPAPKNQY